MFRNYLMIALRNLKKNKLHATINIVGLAVAFICGILLFVFVQHEFSYDTFHNDNNKLYKTYNYIHDKDGESLSPTMGYPQSKMLKTEVPAVEYVSSYMNSGGSVMYNDKEYEMPVYLVDTDFFSMFSFPLVEGDTKNPLRDLGNVIITKKAAKIIFNQVDPIGKSLSVNVNGKWQTFVIAAIAETPPRNSTLNFDVVLRIENRSDFAETKDEWGRQHHPIYAKLRSNFTQTQAEKQIQSAMRKYVEADVQGLKNEGAKPDSKGDVYTIRLLPMLDVHFNSEVGNQNGISKTFLYILVLIGLFVFAIACFNFINLNVARAFTRAREIGVRKCLGAGAKQIFVQLVSESVILTLFALILGIVGVVIVVTHFTEIFANRFDLNILYHPFTIIFIVITSLLISIVTGGYPALLMAKFSTTETLKGKVSLKKPGAFRNSLIVIQFAIASLLICCTMIIYYQFDYLRNASLGFKQENIISIPVYDVMNGRDILSKFRTRLANNPTIENVSGSSINIGIGNDKSQSKWQCGFDFNGQLVNTTMVNVAQDYFKTLGIKIIHGREFTSEYMSDTLGSVIVNESMAKQLGKGNVVGTKFLMDSADGLNIVVGVVPDVHVYSMHDLTEPTTYIANTTSPFRYIFVKVNSENPKQSLDMIASIYKTIEPGKEFKGSFMDENTQRWYEQEKNLANIFFVAADIAIILSCLGLFAIALIIIEQRTKEIGVRKVLGASVFGITTLLSKEFLKLVGISIIIALPIAYFAMNKWLQDFPYRISLHWWLFVLSAGFAVIIALATVSFHSIKAALAKPIKSLRTE
nr:ABC transporter permease [Bacteroidota bacterium]